MNLINKIKELFSKNTQKYLEQSSTMPCNLSEEAKKRHLIRISNLEKEAIEIMNKVRRLEANGEVTRSERETLVNYAIRRLTFIKNEINIRNEVLNGLNSKCVK